MPPDVIYDPSYESVDGFSGSSAMKLIKNFCQHAVLLGSPIIFFIKPFLCYDNHEVLILRLINNCPFKGFFAFRENIKRHFRNFDRLFCN